MSALSDTRNALFVPLDDDGDDVEELAAEVAVASVTHRHYYDPMTAASNWTPADEAAHPRDSEGKFTKKGTGAGGLAELLHNASTLKTGIVAIHSGTGTRMIKTTDGKFRTQQLVNGKWLDTSGPLVKSEATELLAKSDWQLPPSGSAKQVTAPKVTSAYGAAAAKKVAGKKKLSATQGQHKAAIAAQKPQDSPKFPAYMVQTAPAWEIDEWLSKLTQEQYDAFTPAEKNTLDKKIQQLNYPELIAEHAKFISGTKGKLPVMAAPESPQAAVKKAEKSYVNTNVIYKQTYADQQVVAERVGLSGTPSRLIWDAKKKKFILQGQTPTGTWLNAAEFGKGAAYDKFSKQEGWQAPTAVAAAPQPLKINTNVIYKQQYADGTVIAEKVNAASASTQRLVWDEGKKKFILQINNGPNWQTIGTYGKGDAYKKFSKETGWQTPSAPASSKSLAAVKVAAPTPTVTSVVAPKTAGTSIKFNNDFVYGDYTNGQVLAEKPKPAGGGYAKRVVWDADFDSFAVENNVNGNWTTTALYSRSDFFDGFANDQTWLAPSGAQVPAAKVAAIAEPNLPFSGGKKVSELSPEEFEEWWDTYIDVDDEMWNHLSDAEQDAIHAAANVAAEDGIFGPLDTINVWKAQDKQAGVKSLSVTKAVSSGVSVLATWVDAQTRDDWNNLTLQERVAIRTAVQSGPSVPLAAANNKLVQWDNDDGTVTIDVIADFNSGNVPIYPFAFNNWFSGSVYNSDVWVALSPDIKNALFTRAFDADAGGYPEPLAKIKKWDSESAAPAPAPALLPDGKVLAYLVKNPSGSSVFIYDALPGGKASKIVGTVNLAAGELVSDKLDELRAAGKLTPQIHVKTVTDLSAPAVSAPPPPPPVKQPKGYAQHAQATQGIKFIGDIGKPKANVKTFKNTTSVGMLEIQAKSKTSWTPSQTSAIDTYTEPGTSSTGGYQAINAVLRGDESRMKLFSEEQLKKAVANAWLIQDAMAPLAESLELHRGTGAQQFGFPDNHVSTADLKKLEGKILQDRGFVSTSVISPKDGGIPYDYGKKPIKIIVRAPEGTPAVYVTSVLPYQTQNELVLAAGTSFHVADVHAPSAAEKKLYGDQTEQVVILDVVPTPSKPDPKPLPGAAPTPSPSVVTPSAAAPPAATPTPAGLKASDLQLPIKITTGLIHTQKYQHGAVVAYSKGAGDSLSRLTWHEPTKKFQLQKQLSNGTWVNHGPYTKKAAYAAFGGQTWYAPPPGDSALGSGFPFDAAPAVTPPAAPLTGISAQVAALEYNTPVSELNAFFFNLTPDQYGGLTSAEKMKLDDIAQQSLFNNSNPTPSAYLKMLKENAVTPSATSTPLKSQGPPAGTPIKLNTKVIHTTKYAHATVIAVKPQTSAGGPPPHRLVWNQTMKKFVLQVKTSGTDEWHLIPPGQGKTYFTKADAYKTFSPQTGWITPAPGTTAYGSPLFGSAPTPSVATTAHTPSPSMAAPPAPKVKTPPMDAATLQKMHGTVPNFSSGIVDTIYGNFKGSGSDLVTLKTPPADVFAALKKALDEHNSHPALTKLNLLQTLKLIDEKSTPPGGTNSGLYEKKIVDWLQTPSGKSVATKIWSGTADDADALLNGVPAPSTIGTPSAASKVFPTLSVSQAKAMQANMNMGNPWTPEQRSALYQYTGYDHVYINAVLRQAGPGWPNIKDSDDTKKKWRRVAKNAQAAMRPAAQAFTTYRRTEKDALQAMGITNLSKFTDVKKLEGKIFSDRGFGSSSIDPNKWSGYLKFVIEVPEGTPVAWVDDISQNSGEYEVLFAAGTRYRIDRIEDEGWRAVLYVRVVP